MKAIRWSLFLIIAVLLSACGGNLPSTPVPGPSSPTRPAVAAPAGSSSPAPSGPTAPAQPVEPLHAVVTLDESLAAQADIPLEGGQLTLQGKDGTKYTLQIPADALLEPVQVRMTLVRQVEGLPFGSPQAYAVHLEPEGLFFYRPAALTIEPPGPIPPGEQIFFGYQHGGQEVFMAQPDRDTSAIKILVPHFSGYGVMRGFLADVDKVRERLGGSDETRLMSQLNEALQHERQKILSGEDSDFDLESVGERIMREYYEKVVQPRIAAAGDSCAAGRLAVQTVFNLQNLRETSHIGASLPAVDLYKVFQTAASACIKEEYAMCAEQHIIHRVLPVWVSIERQEQLLGLSTPEKASPVVEEARQMVEKCLNFELVFESTGKAMDQSLGYEGSVTASVPLRFKISEMEMRGTGTLVNVSSQFHAEGCQVDFPVHDGTFQVFSLTYKTEPEKFQLDPPLTDNMSEQEKQALVGRVVDFTLRYHPGATGGPLTLVCDDQQMPFGESTAWFGTFMTTHTHEETQTEDGMNYLASQWKILGGELFAERSWKGEDLPTATTEQGTMKLYHRPGQ